MNTQDFKGKFVSVTTDEAGFNNNVEYFQRNVKLANKKFIQELVTTIKKTIKDKKSPISKKFLSLQLLKMCMDTKTMELCSFTAEKILDRLRKIALLTLSNPKDNTDTFNILNLECLYMWKDLPLEIKTKDCNSLRKIKKYKDCYDLLVKKKVVFPSEFMFFEASPGKNGNSRKETVNKKMAHFTGQVISEVHVIPRHVERNKQEDPLEELRKKLGKTELVESKKLIDINALARSGSVEDNGSVYQSEYIPTSKPLKLGDLLEKKKLNEHNKSDPQHNEKQAGQKSEKPDEGEEEKLEENINKKIALLTGAYPNEDNENEMVFEYQPKAENNNAASVSSREMAEEVKFNFDFEDEQKKEESSDIPAFGAGENEINESFSLNDKNYSESVESQHNRTHREDENEKMHINIFQSFQKETPILPENGTSKFAYESGKREFRLSDTFDAQLVSTGLSQPSLKSNSRRLKDTEEKEESERHADLVLTENFNNLTAMMRTIESSQEGLRKEIGDIFRNFEALAAKVVQENDKIKENNKCEKASQTKAKENGVEESSQVLAAELEKIAVQVEEMGRNYELIHENYRCLLKENAEIKFLLQKKSPQDERNLEDSRLEARPKLIINYASAETEPSTEESLESSKRLISGKKKVSSRKTEILMASQIGQIPKSPTSYETHRLSEVLLENGMAFGSKPGKMKIESYAPQSPSEQVKTQRSNVLNSSYIQEESNDTNSIHTEDEKIFNKVVFLEELMLKLADDIKNLQGKITTNTLRSVEAAEEQDDVVIKSSREGSKPNRRKRRDIKKDRKKKQEQDLSDIENNSNFSEVSSVSEGTVTQSLSLENKKSDLATKKNQNVRLSSLLQNETAEKRSLENSGELGKRIAIDKKKQSLIVLPSNQNQSSSASRSDRNVDVGRSMEVPQRSLPGRMSNFSLSPVREESPAFSESKGNGAYQFFGTGNRSYQKQTLDICSLQSRFNHIVPVKANEYEERFPSNANIVFDDGRYDPLKKIFSQGFFNTQLEDFKRMSLVNSGVAFENEFLFIDYNYELGFDALSRKVLSLVLKYGNKCKRPMKGFEIKSIDYSGLKQTSIFEPSLAPGYAVNQKVDLQIAHTEHEALFLETSFELDGVAQVVRISLPVSIIKFISYSKVDNRKFFERQWNESERSFFCTEAKALNRKLFTSSKDIFDLPQYLEVETENYLVGKESVPKTEYACCFDIIIKENFLMRIEEIHGIITFKIRVHPKFEVWKLSKKNNAKLGVFIC